MNMNVLRSETRRQLDAFYLCALQECMNGSFMPALSSGKITSRVLSA
jgi:hypothetical protein